MLLTSALSLPLQTAWLIPLYGFAGMLVSLPWAFGWFRRDAHRPPAYLNILLTLLAVVHGSLVLRDVMANGPALIGMPGRAPRRRWARPDPSASRLILSDHRLSPMQPVGVSSDLI